MNRDWRDSLATPAMTMQQAIERLITEGTKVLFVVDEEDLLLGSVSDGDLRRAQLNWPNMDAQLKDFMNKEPIVADRSASESKLKKLFSMHRITEIPILENGVVIDVISLHNILGKVQHENPVVIMAGGLGSRLRPLTEDCPKPLLKVGTRPMLETILLRFIDCGFYKFYISTHYKSELIKEYFGDGSRYDVKIEYVHEEEPLGTAGVLGLLPEDLAGDSLIMINGDILTTVDFEKLLDFHNEGNVTGTMCVRQYDFTVPYGVVKKKDEYVGEIIEKPMHKFIVNAGIYVFENQVLKLIKANERINTPELIKRIIEKGEKVGMYLVNEYWLDIGRHEDYERAIGDFHDMF